MSDKHYNRSIRAHKTVYEGLQRLRLKSFLHSLGTDAQEEALLLLKQLTSIGAAPTFRQAVQSDHLSALFAKYESFVVDQRGGKPMFDFWSSYLDMVGTLLLALRATREGIWDLHINAVKEMIPVLRLRSCELCSFPAGVHIRDGQSRSDPPFSPQRAC